MGPPLIDLDGKQLGWVRESLSRYEAVEEKLDERRDAEAAEKRGEEPSGKPPKGER